jgi:hypothetical membrane protein
MSGRKYYPYFGISSVLVAYVLIFISISLSPWFSWFNNALSDLGNTSVQRNVSSGAAWTFDAGLIVSGVLMILFAVFLMMDAGFSWKYLIWCIPLALGSVDLSLIGIFNESFGSIHLVVSIVFFFLTALILLLYSYVSFPMGTPRTGVVALILGVFCSAMWIAKFPWQGVAIQEATTSAASAVLVILVCARILKNRMPEPTIRSLRPSSMKDKSENRD